MRSKLGNRYDSVHLSEGDVTLDDAKAPQFLLDVFTRDFSLFQHNALLVPSFTRSSNQKLTFICTTDIVNLAISACFNSAAALMV